MGRLKIKEYELIDKVTGELFAVGVIPYRSLIGGSWMKVFQSETARLIVEHPELHGQSCRVLLYLNGVVGWNNGLPGAEAVGEKLKINRVAVQRAYRELVQAGFIFKEGKMYYLNPMVGWKGTDGEYRAACERLVGGQVGVRQLGTGIKR